MTAMLTPGILDSSICVSSHDVNDGEGELPAAAGITINTSIATTARANGIGMNPLISQTIGFVRRSIIKLSLARLSSYAPLPKESQRALPRKMK
jgi:hypothetical protein